MPNQKIKIARNDLVAALKAEVPKGSIKKEDAWKIGFKEGMKRALEIVDRQPQL